MEKFNKNSRCPKCGGKVETIRFVEIEKIYADTDKDDMGKQAIKKTCSKCYYDWYEKCLDNINE